MMFDLVCILVLLGIAGLCLLVAYLADSAGKKQMGEEKWREFQKAVRADEEAKKYCNYMVSCPVCSSKKVKRITTANRAVSVGVLGLASSKIGKQYECTNCKHKW